MLRFLFSLSFFLHRNPKNEFVIFFSLNLASVPLIFFIFKRKLNHFAFLTVYLTPKQSKSSHYLTTFYKLDATSIIREILENSWRQNTFRFAFTSISQLTERSCD